MLCPVPVHGAEAGRPFAQIGTLQQPLALKQYSVIGHWSGVVQVLENGELSGHWALAADWQQPPNTQVNPVGQVPVGVQGCVARELSAHFDFGQQLIPLTQ